MQENLTKEPLPQKSLRILITNNTLNSFAGSERYVLDLAVSLKKRGHKPVTYSPQLGQIATQLRQHGIPTLDDLNVLGEPPDIIHGHHHLETMTALLHFPNTPAIYYCHGWFPWEEMPLRFPRILRYVAVDDCSEERLIAYGGLAEKNIVRLPSFVDLDKFKRRSHFSRKLKRVLIFGNNVNQQDFELLKAACYQSGIETVDSLGLKFGNAHPHPEEILPHYDLVFACGRSAFEALATGAAVISAKGLGVMITPDNVIAQCWANFGMSGEQIPCTVTTIMHQIKQYDADNAERVCDIIRAAAGKEKTVQKLIDLYTEVITEFQNLPAPDILLEYKATSAYFRHLKKEILRSFSPPASPALFTRIKKHVCAVMLRLFALFSRARFKH